MKKARKTYNESFTIKIVSRSIRCHSTRSTRNAMSTDLVLTKASPVKIPRTLIKLQCLVKLRRLIKLIYLKSFLLSSFIPEFPFS